MWQRCKDNAADMNEQIHMTERDVGFFISVALELLEDRTVLFGIMSV